ncbi:MAG: hypothetical protein U0Y68_03565 [Blastocatellia bacterium]
MIHDDLISGWQCLPKRLTGDVPFNTPTQMGSTGDLANPTKTWSDDRWKHWGTRGARAKTTLVIWAGWAQVKRAAMDAIWRPYNWIWMAGGGIRLELYLAQRTLAWLSAIDRDAFRLPRRCCICWDDLNVTPDSADGGFTQRIWNSEENYCAKYENHVAARNKVR